MPSTTYLCLCILLLATAARCDVTPQYATDRVLVRFKPDTARSTSTVTVSGVSQTAASAAHVGRAATSDVTHVFEITDGMSVADKVKQLSALPEVAIVEPDYIVNVYDTPSDPKFSDQWHHPKISTPIAWDTTTGSPTLKVCVIDSGLRIDHPDLAANVIKGWSVISPTPGGPNPAPTDPAFLNYNDTLGHGTHVSGIIGAVGNNDRGVSGVAWTIGLMPCRFISDSGAGYVSDAITCMQLCQAEGALVYSNSWGGVGFSQTLLAEIQALQTTNGVFVVAAGNNDGLDLDNSPLYPASYTEDNVITVAASTQTDTLAGFSNIGPHSVHLAAPGNSIYSTTYDGLYGTMSGTSMATPMVAGAAALLQGMAVAANAPLAPAQIRQLIMGSVDPIPGGAAAVMSGGRLNVANAVTALKAQFPTQKWPNTPPTGIQVPVAPISSPLPQSPLPQVPQTPRDTGLSVGSMPQCGASPLRGQPATQSSDYNGRSAQNAVNGDCRTDPKKYPSACSSTDPTRSNPWWTAPLPQAGVVNAVSITPRADCCWESTAGAIVMVGNTTWTGSGSRKSFTECGRVPSTISRGQRITVTCSQPLEGSYVAVYLPKVRTSLTLCEVDAAIGAASGGSSLGGRKRLLGQVSSRN